MSTTEIKPNVHVPHFPTYSSARAFLKAIEGQSKRTISAIREKISEHRGTPQDNRDWSEPTVWIPQLLRGAERDLALHIWQSTQGLVNPRHMLGLWLLCSSYALCEPDNSGLLRITPSGHDFLNNHAGRVVQQLDYSEGLLALLAIVAEHGPGKRGDLLPHFREFLLANSRRQAPSVVSSTWYNRIVNLVERGLIRRDGVTYTIDATGIEYLEQGSSTFQQIQYIGQETTNDLRKLLDRQTKEVRQELLKTLRGIKPYQLEQLVGTLLSAIGYENVEVTKASNDGGVDVVGDITIGITYVREVVQVKRHQSNIQRKTLDELRGSLHRFKAYRGTIITTGNFSNGAKQAAFEQGAAPITLIDGDRLVDLLIEHEIGVQKEQVTVLKFLADDFISEDDVL